MFEKMQLRPVAYVKIGSNEVPFYLSKNPQSGEPVFFVESGDDGYMMQGNASTNNHLEALKAHYGADAVRAPEHNTLNPSSYEQAAGRVARSSIDDLDHAQRAALITFRAQNGRSWKQKLNDGWLKAAYPGPLQQIRNQFGPEWLANLKHVPTYRLDVTLLAVDGSEGHFSVSLDAQGRAAESVATWSPQKPDVETESVTIQCYDGDELKAEHVADGDFWRELESGGHSEELWDSVLKGLPLAEAIEALPSLDNKCRI
ncbi:hypothetical protein [Chromobacterium haemolyticum]|uniref:hypothetical protein n=1 Tax=Chromobacterium haemolyticum TaxID=394935 RepID=UPI00244AC455|nr:hypothetical protein [Chromobacterium haemolyticum]MDH0342041.1 hypothetical protein [Chromobacterium haemolyticum]